MGAPVIVSLEGLPGSGKTTTARHLSQREGLRYLHERSAEVPFLDAFYRDRERYKLETELCFVLVHYHQYRDIAENTVLDYSPVKDLVFADLNLEGSDYELFMSVYQRTVGSLWLPAAVIFLELELDHLLERIQARGREYERDFDARYLAGVRDAYEERFAELGQRCARVQVTRGHGKEHVTQMVAEALGRLRRDG